MKAELAVSSGVLSTQAEASTSGQLMKTLVKRKKVDSSKAFDSLKRSATKGDARSKKKVIFDNPSS